MAVVMTVFDRFHSFPRVCSNMHRVWILSALAAVIAFIGCGREKCLDSTDCEGGFVCRTDRCVVLECIGQETCADDEVCAAGRFIDADPSKDYCTARCSVFNRCPEGRHCSDGLCLASGEDTDGNYVNKSTENPGNACSICKQVSFEPAEIVGYTAD